MWRHKLINLVFVLPFFIFGFFVLGRVLFDEHRSVASVSHPCTFFFVGYGVWRESSPCHTCVGITVNRHTTAMYSLVESRNQFCLILSKYFATFVFILPPWYCHTTALFKISQVLEKWSPKYILNVENQLVFMHFEQSIKWEGLGVPLNLSAISTISYIYRTIQDMHYMMFSYASTF